MAQKRSGWQDIIDHKETRRGEIPAELIVSLPECIKILERIGMKCLAALERDMGGSAGKLYAALTTISADYRQQQIADDLLGFGVTDPAALEAHRQNTGYYEKQQKRQDDARTTIAQARALLAQAMDEKTVDERLISEFHNAIAEVVCKKQAAHGDKNPWGQYVPEAEQKRGDIPAEVFLTSVEAKRILRAVPEQDQRLLREAFPLLGSVFDDLAKVAGTSWRAVLLPVQQMAHSTSVMLGNEAGQRVAGKGLAALHQEVGREPAEGLKGLQDLRDIMDFAQETLQQENNQPALEALTQLHNAITDVLGKSQHSGRGGQSGWGRG